MEGHQNPQTFWQKCRFLCPTSLDLVNQYLWKWGLETLKYSWVICRAKWNLNCSWQMSRENEVGWDTVSKLVSSPGEPGNPGEVQTLSRGFQAVECWQMMDRWLRVGVGNSFPGWRLPGDCMITHVCPSKVKTLPGRGLADRWGLLSTFQLHHTEDRSPAFPAHSHKDNSFQTWDLHFCAYLPIYFLMHSYY